MNDMMSISSLLLMTTACSRLKSRQMNCVAKPSMLHGHVTGRSYYKNHLHGGFLSHEATPRVSSSISRSGPLKSTIQDLQNLQGPSRTSRDPGGFPGDHRWKPSIRKLGGLHGSQETTWLVGQYTHPVLKNDGVRHLG